MRHLPLKTRLKRRAGAALDAANYGLCVLSERITRKQVAFVIAGAQKSGTTALHAFLSQHPDISMPMRKETDFFSYNYSTDYRQYHRTFGAFTGGKVLGEACPSYMLHHKVAAPRMKEYNPSLKLIFVLRDPVERAYSQYKMHKEKHSIALSFEECLELLSKDTNEKVVLDPHGALSLSTIRSYLEFGRYARQIASFQNEFPAEQLLILRMDELMERHTETLERVFEFLDVRPIAVPPRMVHSRKGEGMTTFARSILWEEFKDEVAAVEALTGWDLERWKHGA